MMSRRLVELTKQLDALERIYVNALDAAGVGLWVWESKTDTLHWDARMLQIYDITANEFESSIDFFRNLVHEDDLPLIKKEMEQSKNTGKPFSFSFRVRNKQNDIITIHTKGKAEKMEDDSYVFSGVSFRENLVS